LSLSSRSTITLSVPVALGGVIRSISKLELRNAFAVPSLGGFHLWISWIRKGCRSKIAHLQVITEHQYACL
jgi:hypothetical protein